MRRFELDHGDGRVAVARRPGELLTLLLRAGATLGDAQRTLQQLHDGFRSANVPVREGLYVRVYSLP